MIARMPASLLCSSYTVPTADTYVIWGRVGANSDTTPILFLNAGTHTLRIQ